MICRANMPNRQNKHSPTTPTVEKEMAGRGDDLLICGSVRS
ncbi:hypothetical protein [Moraxella lacunata]